MSIDLPDHALARLPLEYGEELLIVLPVESQPKPDTKRLLPDLFGDGKWYRVFDTPTGEHVSLIDGHDPPHRPGDVLEIRRPAEGPIVTYHKRLTVQRVECKRVRDVTDIEWSRAGFTGTAWFERNLARGWWDDTYADLDWKSNPWVWLVWAVSWNGRKGRDPEETKEKTMEEKADQVSADTVLVIERLEILLRQVLEHNPAATIDVEVVTADGAIKIGVNRLHNL